MSNKNTISLSATLSTGGGGGGGDKKKSSNNNSSSNNDNNAEQIGPKKPRTIQVKIGNQAAKEMTPDQAADYLRLLATAGAAAAATAGGGGSTSGGGGRSGSSSSHYNSSSGGGGGGGPNGLLPQQVKMTFQNGTTETVPLTSGPSGGGGSSGSSSGNLFRKSNKKGSSSDPSNNMPCTEKEMKALMSMFVEIMGLQMNTDKLNKQQYRGGKKKKSKDGKKNGSTGSSSKKQLFHFPADLPPPPGGWPEDLLWPNGGIPGTGVDGDDDDEYEYVDDDSEEECSSLPDLEEIPLDVREKAAASAATAALTSSTRTAAAEAAKNAASSTTASSASLARKTGLVAGIAIPEWDALERVAMEEALEQEERARKSSKAAASSNSTAASLSTSFLRSTVMEALTSSASASSSGGLSGSGSSGAGSRSATANSQAAAARAAAQATAAQKRRAKASQVWRTKVIAACQSCDLQALNQLLKHDVQVRKEWKQLQEKEGSSGTAITPDDSDPSVQSPTFDVLLPYCLPNSKNHRASMKKTQETRQRLARHLWSICPSRLSQQPMRNGRTVLHMACLYGDTPLVQLIMGNCIVMDDSLPSNKEQLQAMKKKGRSGLNFTCQDSGWTPLHYAALSGSMETLEMLLHNGANLTAVTDDIHTSWMSSGKGLTAKQLVDVVASGKVDKQVETHGMALKEVTKEFLTSSTSSDDSSSDVDTRKYLAWLQRISNRLATLEKAKKNSKASNYYTEPSKDDLCDWDQEVVSQPVAAPVVVVVDETTKTKAKAAVPVAAAAAVPVSDSSESDSSSKGGTDIASLVPPESVSNQNNETKKKGKKKKKKGGGNSTANTTESAPSSTGSAVTSATTAEDPLVTALKGMGFAEEQILAGLKACGGASRATPDMIVAWIFEQESGGGASAASAASASANGSDSGNSTKKKVAPMEFTQQQKKRGSDTKPSSNKSGATKSSSQQQQDKTGSDINAVAEQKRKEVKQREAEKKLAADRLTAKREEQRRRNREWNKKQEAQRAEVVARTSVTSNASTSSATNAKETPAAAAVPPTLMTGLPTAMAAPAPAPSSLKQPQPGLASLPPATAATTASMPPAEIATDASTNDDATVSTIGSRTTTTQPSIRQTLSNGGGNVVGPPLHHQQQQQISQSQQHGAPVAPPGFGPSVAAVPESVPMTEETWQQASMGLGQRLYAPSAPGMAAAAPPPAGIAFASRPRVDQRAHASSLTAQSMGSLQSRMSAAQEAFAGSFSSSSSRPSNVAGGATPGPATSTAPLGGAPVGSSSGFGPSSLFGLQSSSSSLLGQEQHHHSVSSMSEQNFAQASSSTLGSHAGMDSSSFIESISTGNAPIGGASLWGGSHHNATGGTAGSSLLVSPPPGSSGGSSLLGNLIQNNDSRQVDSLFSMDNQRSSSFNGWGEDTPQQHHRGPGGAPGGGGGNRSNSIGGHPDSSNNSSHHHDSRRNINRGSGSSIW